MPNEPLMMMSLKRYEDKLLKVLNNSLAWNFARLPHNTFELQFAKYQEEVDEAIEAEKVDYQRFVEELADILISIGGMMRFDEVLAVEMLNALLSDIDKFYFMDMVDYAEQKIKILYERDYSKDGYHH